MVTLNRSRFPGPPLNLRIVGRVQPEKSKFFILYSDKSLHCLEPIDNNGSVGNLFYQPAGWSSGVGWKALGFLGMPSNSGENILPQLYSIYG